MSETIIRAEVSEGSAHREINFFELLLVVVQRKKLILGVALLVAIISALGSLALPNVYKATTRLLPPQQPNSGASALLSQLGGAAGLVAGVTGLKNPGDMYVGMLKSRTIADRLINKFDLKRVYDESVYEKVRADLESKSSFISGKDGLITIEVEDEDPKRSAALANAYVEELRALTKGLALSEAAQRRVFYEEQLELAKNNLAQAEIAMKRRLDTQGVISVDAESRAVLETVGRLRASVSAKEIELNSMRTFVTANNPVYRRVSEELSSMRAELSSLENGRASPASPAVNKRDGLESIKLLRDVKYFQMLYEVLAKQYEVARLEEAKDSSVIQVLDPAVVPELKVGPKRALIVIMATLFAIFTAIGWALAVDTKRRVLASPEGRARWLEFRAKSSGARG